MPDLKFQAILEATEPKQIAPELQPFLDNERSRLLIEATRRQPPTCYWVTYRYGPERLVLKSFFSEDDYFQYSEKLARHYPNRVNEPTHPRGGFRLLPDMNAVAWKFPFDPAMPGLDRCLDSAWIADAMGFSGDSDLRAQVLDYSAENDTIVAYRPPGRPPIAFGKAGPADTAGLQFLVMQRLWNSPAREAGTLRLARPLAYRSEVGLLLQSRVPGRSIPPARNRQAFLDLARYAGSALSAVHAADIPFGSERGIYRLIDRLDDDLEDLALSAPTLFPEVRRLVRQLEVRAARSRPSPLVPSHGDYKYDQLLRCRGDYSLIDFELFCQSEPALDLGTFCAYLPSSTPEDWRDGLAAEICRGAFLTAYQEASGEPIDWDRLALYESAMVAVRGLAHVWRGNSSGAELRASEMIDLAFERLANPQPQESAYV